MDADIVSLVNSGATTLLGLMVTDSWGKTKKVAAALFSRRRGPTEAVETELEASSIALRQAIELGDAETEMDLIAEWRSRLRRAVQDDKNVIKDLREFVEDNSDSVREYSNRLGKISLSANARDSARVYQQGQGRQINY